MFKPLYKLFDLLGKQYQKSFILVFISILIIALFEVLSIGIILPFLKLIMDEANNVQDSYLSGLKLFLNLDGNQTLILLGFTITSLFLVKNILHYFINKFQVSVLNGVRDDISKLFFKKYMNMNYSVYIEKNISSMYHNATGQVNAFVALFLTSILNLVAELVIVLAILILLFAINWKVMLVLSFFGFLIVLLMMKKFKSIFKDIGKKQHDAILSMYKVMQEGVNGLKEVRVLGVEQYFTDLFDQNSNIYKELTIKSSSLQLLPKLILEFIFIGSLISVIIFSLSMQYDLKELVPTLILFTMAFFKIFPSINRIITYYNQIMSSKVSLDVLHKELMEATGQNVYSTRLKNYNLTFKEKISLKNLTFSYKNSKNIFENFSIDIPKNSTIALIGKSGSGKTTLVDLILGLIQPQQGSVELDSKNINQNLDDWYKKISYIPQTISFIDDTIRNNIALGITQIDVQQLEKSIDEAQLRELIDSLPEGLDTQIGDKGIKLSGGQRQRIGIARALYKNPEILIFDEATSALDVETERALTDAIQKLGHNKTIIIVAHRLSTIKDSDIIFILDQGRINDSGTYEELLSRNKWFQKINK